MAEAKKSKGTAGTEVEGARSTPAVDPAQARRRKLLLEALFLAVVALAVVGLALTNASPALGYRYWLVTIALFALAGVLVGNIRAHAAHRPLMKVTLDQVAHWGVTLLAVFLVHMLVMSGRITYEAAGFVMMLLVGEAVTLDGIYQTGWRFAMVGLTIMAMAIITAWFALYVWMLVVGGLLVWALLAYLEHRMGKTPAAE